MFVFMTTAAQLVDRFAPLMGLLPSTVERQLRAQRAAGQTPIAGRGGGKNSAHFNACHMAYVLLGLVGQQPSDAPAVAELLYKLPYLKTEGPHKDMMRPAPTLGEAFVQMLEVARKLLSQRETTDSIEYNIRLDTIRSWTVDLCFKLTSYATITSGFSESLRLTYGDDSPELAPLLIRLTKLRGRLFLVAAEMLTDTYTQQNATSATLPLNSNESAKARQEQKSAGHLRQEVPAPSSDQTHANGSGGLTTPEGIRENKDFQG